jgi:hypothetical protein
VPTLSWGESAEVGWYAGWMRLGRTIRGLVHTWRLYLIGAASVFELRYLFCRLSHDCPRHAGLALFRAQPQRGIHPLACSWRRDEGQTGTRLHGVPSGYIHIEGWSWPSYAEVRAGAAMPKMCSC